MGTRQTRIGARRLAVLALGLAAGPARASGGITATAHDFTRGYKGFRSDTLCETCHTPHAADAAVPIWGWAHETTTATYTMYTSATMESTPLPAQPTAYSLACLSCHDGTVAVDAYAGNPGENFITRADGSTYIGVDLSDDHPVSVLYPTQSAKMRSNVSLPLHDGRVECSTCHDPHTSDQPDFLRMSNSGSALCLACHVK